MDKNEIFVIFSKNNKIGSKFISWGSSLLLRENMEIFPSHAAILIKSENKEFVLESTFLNGVRKISYEKWLEINTECYKFKFENLEKKYVMSKFNKLKGKKYDYLGVMYFLYAFVLNFVFKKPFPSKNPWQKKDKFFCTELVGKIVEHKNYSMVTPAKMCYDLIRKVSK